MRNPLIYLVQKMWRYAGKNRRNMVLYMAMSTVANFVIALEPLVVGLILNTIQTQGVSSINLPNIFLLFCLLPLLELIFWSLHGTSRVMENRNAFIIEANYKNHLLSGTVALPLEWHTDHHSGDTIDKIEKGTRALFNFSEGTFEIISTIIMLTTAYGALFFFDWISGAAAFTLSFLTFLIVSLFDKKLVVGYKQVNRMENITSAKVFDALSNITTVIILRAEKLVLKSIDTFIQKPFSRYYANSKLNEWKWFSSSILGRITVVTVVLIYIGTHFNQGTILIGTIYIIYGYANQIRDTFFRFTYLYNNIIRYRASVSNAEELSKDFQKLIKTQENKLPKNWSSITIKDLSFSYHAEDGADLHLDKITMDINHGQRIALIGESGGGKTTFLKIMRDLYHPKNFDFLIDGAKASGGFLTIKDSISLIPQDPEIFSTTIRENLTLGVEYSESHLKIFTDMAAFTNIVNRLPKKLESSIVEKGVNLSGGEKQRLALARGLMASVDKEIILLDEPTSSVDFQNELTIYQNIFQAFPNKTIIASIHRLHLLSLFDIVYLFEGGKITGFGSPEQLKKSSPIFKKLWTKYLKSQNAQR